MKLRELYENLKEQVPWDSWDDVEVKVACMDDEFPIDCVQRFEYDGELTCHLRIEPEDAVEEVAVHPPFVRLEPHAHVGHYVPTLFEWNAEARRYVAETARPVVRGWKHAKKEAKRWANLMGVGYEQR